MNKIKKASQLGVLLCGASFVAPTMAVDLGEYNGTAVTLKGYVKMDAIVSDYEVSSAPGASEPASVGRDFYVPSTTTVGDESYTVVDMHARQTRFALATSSDVDGTALKTYIEMDFMVTPNGDERISNSYSPRMRHAFLTYGNWLYGQTWSTFMNVGALPETLDFIGNTDATIFVRQAQVRYTHGDFQFSVENPETTITPFGGGARIVTDDNSVPDVVARYNYSKDNLSFAVAGLVRQLEYNDAVSGIDESTSGFGLSLSGKLNIGKDDVKVVLNTGSGMGRYIGLNIANDAVIKADGELEAIDTTGFSVSYRHFWSEQWRSTILYSTINIDNDEDLTGTSVSKNATSVRANLLYSPTKRLTLGGELTQASREIESGDDGSMTRLQLSAKLDF